MVKKIIISANNSTEPMRYWELNEKIHKAADEGCKHIIVKDVMGQRFIGAGMEHKDVKIDIYGVPGNNLGVFMDGPTIEVFGNAEDQIGNTMNSGTIIIHGNAWDVSGLAARGGKIFVKGDGGYRIGIHMKEYDGHKPILVYGGSVKEFFGEYMAGGILVALGLKIKDGVIEDVPPKEVVAGSLGSGIHGGIIYIRGEIPKEHLGIGATVQEFTEEDKKMLTPVFEEFCSYFNVPIEKIWERKITKIVPTSTRPYAAYYNPRSI